MNRVLQTASRAELHKYAKDMGYTGVLKFPRGSKQAWLDIVLDLIRQRQDQIGLHRADIAREVAARRNIGHIYKRATKPHINIAVEFYAFNDIDNPRLHNAVV